MAYGYNSNKRLNNFNESQRKKKLFEKSANTTTIANKTQTSSLINLIQNYKWVISNIDIDKTKKRESYEVKKYQRLVDQVKIEFNQLYD